MCDVKADDKLAKKLEEELEWVKYRIRMLDIIETKLLEMRAAAKFAADNSLDEAVIDVIQTRINDLEMQINALDSESSKALFELGDFLDD